MLFNNCVILAGGKSSRMGEDKAFMKFGGFNSLIEFQVNKFSKIFNNIYVSGKNNKFNNFDFKTIDDKFSDFSPMGAIYSILHSFKNEEIFIIPVDMVFVKFKSIEILYENFEGCEICVAKDKFHTHSLCGFFSSDIAKKALYLYKDKNHKIKNLFEKVKFKEIFFDDNSQFFNMNYQKDYDEAIMKFKENI